MAYLHVRTLGTPHIELDGEPVKLDTRKSVALLLYLAVTNSAHTRESLETMFWPESDHKRARTSLRRSLWSIRHQIGEEFLVTDGQDVELNTNANACVDALSFRRSVGEKCDEPSCTTRLCRECRNRIEEAIRLHEGRFLAGFGVKDSVQFDDWQLAQEQDLTETVIASLQRLIDHFEAEGELRQAVIHGRRWIDLDPTDESAYRRVMELSASRGLASDVICTYRQCQAMLRRELGIEPGEESKEIYRRTRQCRSSSVAEAEVESPPCNLPRQLTTFVGRRAELTSLQEQVRSASLITLTGAGGSGKTRLAIELAATLCDQYEDGAWFVDLAPAIANDQIVAAVATALGIQQTRGEIVADMVVESLRQKHAILVMDNCEHIIKPVSKFIELLLRHCDYIVILATSREALSIPGECEWTVEPLDVPSDAEAESLTCEELRGHESTSLFVERALAIEPQLMLTDSASQAAGKLCRRLDGIPLAVEMAAARIRSLSVEQIVDRLDGYFKFLHTEGATTVPRHRTLEATIDWSYGLLEPEEAILLRRLSVFSGGWTLDAAECVCGEIGEEAPNLHRDHILDLCAGLVAKSMVRKTEASGAARYSFLEIVRQYARNRLDESGETETLLRRHRDYYLRLAEDTEPGLYGGDRQIEGFEILMADHHNVTAAIEWTLHQPQGEVGLRFGASLWWYWFVRGYCESGRAYLTLFLEHAHDKTTSLYGRVASALAITLWYFGEFNRIHELSEASYSIHKTHGDENGMGYALLAAALGDYTNGSLGGGSRLIDRTIRCFRRSGDDWGLVNALRLKGVNDADEGELTNALELALQVGDRVNLTWLYHDIAVVLQERGELDQAMELVEDSLELAEEMHSRWSSAQVFGLMSSIEEKRGNTKAALRATASWRRILLDMGLVAGAPNTLARMATQLADLSDSQAASVVGGHLERHLSSPSLEGHQRKNLQSRLEEISNALGGKLSRSEWRRGYEMSPGRATRFIESLL